MNFLFSRIGSPHPLEARHFVVISQPSFDHCTVKMESLHPPTTIECDAPDDTRSLGELSSPPNSVNETDDDDLVEHLAGKAVPPETPATAPILSL